MWDKKYGRVCFKKIQTKNGHILVSTRSQPTTTNILQKSLIISKALPGDTSVTANLPEKCIKYLSAECEIQSVK